MSFFYNDDDEYDDDRTPMKKFVDWLVFGPEDAAENEDDGFREVHDFERSAHTDTPSDAHAHSRYALRSFARRPQAGRTRKMTSTTRRSIRRSGGGPRRRTRPERVVWTSRAAA